MKRSRSRWDAPTCRISRVIPPRVRVAATADMPRGSCERLPITRARTPARVRRAISLPSVEERLRQEPPGRPPGIDVLMGLVRERVLAQRA